MSEAEPTRHWTVGTDTGGTFTDLVAVADDGEVRVVKVPSTPPEFQRGVVDALASIGLPIEQVRSLHHGTTVTTNALITRTGASTALLTTEGFRDVLELRDGSRGEYYDVNWDPPAPLVARPNRLPVRERIDYEGNVLVALDEAQLRSRCEALRERNVEAVAICFIHSYANMQHERRALAIVEEELPGAYVTASVDVLPEPPEFPRTSTTVANAYVGPVLERYLAKLEAAVAEFGYRGAVLIMHSGGGIMTPSQALRVPIRTATSGPAAGAMAAAAIARTLGRPSAVSLDMGGTSADISAIRDGEPAITVEQTVEWGLPVGFPSIDLIAIGAGGGSIAWVDDAGAPHVGPQSAGALPGPACYSRGGIEPTTTDANLVLGRLRPASLLGGGMAMDRSLAETAIATGFAAPLGLDLLVAADGIVRIANEHMANGIRRVTIQRGLDPREFSLIAFGGAGPMHAAAVAQMLQIPEVIVPAHPGATSAYGLVTVDARHDLVRSHICDFDQLVASKLEAQFVEMEKDARDTLLAEGYAPADVSLGRQIDVRYVGQVRALPIVVPAGPITATSVEAIRTQFHETYEQEFKYAVPDLAVETKSLRVQAVGAALTAAPVARTTGDVDAVVERRPVYFGESTGLVDTNFYRRDLLTAGTRFTGPAIIEQYDSTTVVPPATQVEVAVTGDLILTFD